LEPGESNTHVAVCIGRKKKITEEVDRNWRKLTFCIPFLSLPDLILLPQLFLLLLQGGPENVTSMFLYLAREYFSLVPPSGAAPGAVRETPALGCLHPAYEGGYFESPADYLRWYER
jgi:cobalamin biosynthesis Mg chelatase CobN